MARTKDPTTSYGGFYKGESASAYDINGFDELINCDIHTEIGSVRPNFALIEDDDANAPDEACVFETSINGDVYAGSTTTGKIWKWTQSSGIWSLAHTSAVTGHRALIYYDGYLYYMTALKLGRYDLASTWVDQWQTFTNGNALKPVTVSLNALCIGDGNLVASVDSSGTFTANALDLPEEQIIACVTDIDTDLLIGTQVNSEVHEAMIYRWDNLSSSWWSEFRIKVKPGVKAFIHSEEGIFAQVGNDGKIYELVGSTAFRKKKQMRGTTLGTDSNKVATKDGKPIMALNGYIWSIYRRDPGLPWAICKEYTCSQGNDVVINAITLTGDQIFVSWTDGATSGVDKVGTDYAVAIVTTPIRDEKIQTVKIAYDENPSGATITAKKKSDHASGWGNNIKMGVDSEDDMVAYNYNNIGNKRSVQFRLSLAPNGSSPLVISNIKLYP